ncbi:tripartite tricarboxylate transporter TctB family protein [Cohaesibacter gelatinilyticus]|uniref:Tripartite tricarboxylate transporter TctB family protein n=1 Tax=Cohaesibacter gelatinilyticus TaxID=372072 RepID=A0A285PC11_9HYPH|nr:tripartite tricarboxylate transporter TctB family protein [Cohaesibacter gelatinilyticus]SNZ19259.1 Tripartite tricarboxylate transporter TctB family protein [Cohaesibacter gelatinilyticus]
MQQRKSDTICGLVLIGFSTALYFYLIPNFVANSESGAMSPQFFPRLGTILIGFGGLALISLSGFTKSPKQPEINQITLKDRLAKFQIALLIAATMAGFILMFQSFGYFYATPPTIAALMLLFGARNPLIILLVAATTTATLFIVFSFGLNLPLV